MMWAPIPADDADRHVFGAVLLNDWSARDIQGFDRGDSFGELVGTVAPAVLAATSTSIPTSIPREQKG